MKIIRYIFENAAVVEIELANTAFVAKWLDYLETIDLPNLPMQSSYWKVAGRVDERELWKISEKFTPLLDMIGSGLNFLENYFGFKFYQANEFLEDTRLRLDKTIKTNGDIHFQVPQEYLNTWHRIFTSAISGQNILGKPLVLYNPDMYDKLKLVEDINTAVHKLEALSAYYYNDRRQQFYGQMISIIFRNANTEFDPKKQMRIFNTVIKDHYDHVKDDHWQYDVWLNEDIAGKDMIRCWLDYDGFQNTDITGNLMMTPSVLLDLDQSYNRVLNDAEFMRCYNETHKTLDRFPIGRIVRRDTNLQNNSQVIKTEILSR
jgi:hypothetical protein